MALKDDRVEQCLVGVNSKCWVHKYFLASKLAPKGAAMLVHSGFTNQEQKNIFEKSLVTDLIPLAHIPALFMTSMTKAAGHKMAALTIVFSQLENVDVVTNRTRSEVK